MTAKNIKTLFTKCGKKIMTKLSSKDMNQYRQLD